MIAPLDSPLSDHTFGETVTSLMRPISVVLSMEIPVSSLGTPRSVAFKDGSGAFAFQGLAVSPVPDWLSPDLWTCLRVIVRGHTGANEIVRARFLRNGAVVLIR